jgi:hypothetical protein
MEKMIMTDKMTLIEAMKEQKLILKKIEKNTVRIAELSSKLDSEKPIYATEADQRKAINELAQSNEDLAMRYMQLRAQRDYTNMFTYVAMNGKEYSISELVLLRQKLGKLIISTYEAMSDKAAEAKLSSRMYASSTNAKVERLYDEETRMNKLNDWQDFIGRIDARLEVVNATTQLMDLPKKV